MQFVGVFPKLLKIPRSNSFMSQNLSEYDLLFREINRKLVKHIPNKFSEYSHIVVEFNRVFSGIQEFLKIYHEFH